MLNDGMRGTSLIGKFAQKENIHRGIFVVVVALVAMAIYKMNRMTPWIVDDFLKAQGAAKDPSISGYITALFDFYRNWGGRIWGELVAISLLAIPKSIVNVLNTLAYLAMIFLMYFNIVGRKKVSVSLFLLLNVSLWMFLPAFGQDILWISGCANYMWSSIIPLAFLAIYRRYDEAPFQLARHPLFCLLIGGLGLLSGWMNENVSVAILWILAGYLLCYRHVSGEIPAFAKVGFAGTLLGAFCLWLAPGNFARFEAEHHTTSILTIFRKIFTNCYNLLQMDTGLVLAFLIIMLVLFGKSNKKKLSLLYGSASFIGAMAFSVVGEISMRVLLGPIILLTISLGLAYKDNFMDVNGKLARILLSLFLLCSLASLNRVAKGTISDYGHQWAENVRIIETEKSRGNLDVVVNPMHPQSRFCAAYGLDDIKPAAEIHHWLNQGLAGYYHLHSIQSVRITD